jgi:hypothetical protein
MASSPPFSKVAFSINASTPIVLLGTPEVPVAGTLVAIEILSATKGAHLWALDTVTGSTTPRLAQSDNLGGPLAAGVRVGFNRPFSNGLSLLCTGTITGNAVVQVA